MPNQCILTPSRSQRAAISLPEVTLDGETLKTVYADYKRDVMETQEKTEETATSTEETQEQNADATEETTEAGSESQEDSQHIDWKKIAEDEQNRREKAEKALADKRFKAKKDAPEKEEVSEDDKPITAAELRKILADDRKATQREFMSGRVEEIATKLTDSKDEATAVIEIFNNRSFPSDMPLENQLQEAYFIAHGPRLLAKRDELRRSLRSKDTKKADGTDNTHRDAPKGGEPNLSPQDKTELKRLGFTWDGKQYSKKLQNGKMLVKDWQSKKVFVK